MLFNRFFQSVCSDIILVYSYVLEKGPVTRIEKANSTPGRLRRLLKLKTQIGLILNLRKNSRF